MEDEIDLGIMEKRRMQVKCHYDTGRMHIQVISDVDSQYKIREYGYAVKLPCPHQVSEWLRLQDPVYESAAKTGKNYILMEALVYPAHTIGGRPTVQYLIQGSVFNHQQGLVLNSKFNKKDALELVRYLDDINMLNNMEGEPYYPPQEEGEEE